MFPKNIFFKRILINCFLFIMYIYLSFLHFCKELFTLPKNPVVFSGDCVAQSLVFVCVVFCIFLCSFSFGYCIVCPLLYEPLVSSNFSSSIFIIGVKKNYLNILNKYEKKHHLVLDIKILLSHAIVD